VPADVHEAASGWLASTTLQRGKAKPSGSGRETEQLLQLDRVAWPRRDAPQMRASIARIATGLATHSESAPAVERARAALEWLVATSASTSEEQRWNRALQQLPAR
jgi:hypothetical protein